ncbi:hypothetical protein TRIUR3_15922 [Triticum urartu]|uniref:Uncharacterized protein n=1 Tax=Triticum urartu TaxID=4572 RepID=M8A8H7_TRIUA|nr:hypothetical protein TRIUR3_15922 [Triticum urartu]
MHLPLQEQQESPEKIHRYEYTYTYIYIKHRGNRIKPVDLEEIQWGKESRREQPTKTTRNWIGNQAAVEKELGITMVDKEIAKESKGQKWKKRRQRARA